MSIDKISALLAMAESTENEAEADAFMSKAQMLATAYSIDLALARSHAAKASKREEPMMRQVNIGERGKHINKYLVELFHKVTQNNDLKITISFYSTYVNLYGMPSDIDVSEAIYVSLSHQMVSAANEFIADGTWKGEAFKVWNDREWDYEWKPYTAKTARNAFYKGYIERIGTRLYEARNQAIKEYKAGVEHAPVESGQVETKATGAEVVLKAKTEEVGEFYRKTSNARGSWKGSSSKAGGSASNAGRSAANSARLGAQRGIGGKRVAIA